MEEIIKSSLKRAYNEELKEDIKTCIRQAKTWIAEIVSKPVSQPLDFPTHENSNRVIYLSDRQISSIKAVIEDHYKYKVNEIKCWTEADNDCYGTNYYAKIVFGDTLSPFEQEMEKELQQVRDKYSKMK